MTDKKTPPKAPSNKPPVAPEDFEKTLLDVQVPDLEKMLDETLIFKRPALDNEDTDLHGRKKSASPASHSGSSAPTHPQEEKTLFQPIELPPPSEEDLNDLKLEEEPASETPLKRSTAKAASSVESEAPAPQIKLPDSQKTDSAKPESKASEPKIPETLPTLPAEKKTGNLLGALGAMLMILLLGFLSADGFRAQTPFAKILIGVTGLSVLVTAGLGLGLRKPGLGGKFSAVVFLGVLGFSIFRYGSADPSAWVFFKRPASDWLSLIFLGINLCLLAGLFWRRRRLLPLQIPLALLLVFSIAGFAEGLLRSGFPGWRLEDILLGTDVWALIPLFYLRPIPFYFYALLPLLFVYFALFSSITVSTTSSRRSFFLPLWVLLVFALGQLILLQNHLPSAFAPVLRSGLGIGKAPLIEFQTGPVSSFLVTEAYLSQRDSDRLPLYQMAATVASADPKQKTAFLTVRREDGRLVPFLKMSDLKILQEDGSLKPAQISFMEKSVVRQKNLVLLVDRSNTMGPILPTIDAATQPLIRLLNSREKLWLASFAEDFKITQPSGNSQAVSWLGSLASQGNRNLSAALVKTADQFKSVSGEKAIFLITEGDLALAEDVQGKLVSQLKNSHTRLFVFSASSTPLTGSLKTLAEATGGLVFSFQEIPALTADLMSSFVQAFGEYQVRYEAGESAVKFSILTPAPESEITQETPLKLKILNPSEARVKKTYLWVDDKPLLEMVVQGFSEFSFPVSPQQAEPGRHIYRVKMITEDDREFTQDIPLKLSSSNELGWLRPMDGDSVRGQVNLEVYFTSHTGLAVTHIDFLMDGQKIGESNAEPYLLTYDVQSATGEHVFQANATLTDGSAQTAQIKLNFVPGPSLKLVSPATGEFLGNLAEMEADLSQGFSDAVQKVEFFADGNRVGEVVQAPFKYLWDNSSLESGKHRVQARATLASGQTTSEGAIVNIGSGQFQVVSEGLAVTEGSSSLLSPDVIEWIVDTSQSMEGTLSADSKLNAIQQALLTLPSYLSSSTQVAIRSLAGKSTQALSECSETSLLLPFQPNGLQQMPTSLKKLSPKGRTPLALALEKARGDLKNATGSRALILLVDGFEDCGKDPFAVIEQWKKERFSTRFYILGLDLAGTRAEGELKRLASAAGGQYLNIKDEKDLSKSLEEVVKIQYRVFDYRNRPIAEKPVGSPAITLRSGEYRVQIGDDALSAKDKVVINNGMEKKLILKKSADHYIFEETN